MLAGPYATMLLADLGAEVTKIEPAGGEISRGVGAQRFRQSQPQQVQHLSGSDVRCGAATLGRAGSGIPCAAGEPETVGHPPAGSHLRALAAVQRSDRLCRDHRLRPARWRRSGFRLRGAGGFRYCRIDRRSGRLAGTLPGYSSADNSTGMCAALGLLAKIVSGTGGQVDVSLRDVMLSQLNYHASAYLNNGVEPQRRPYGAHSYYVPAQLFPTADGYLALFITHDGFWKSFAAEAGIGGFETMAERVARRDEVLAVVTAMLATDTAAVGIATASARSARGGRQDAARGAQGDAGSGRDCGRFPPGRESDPRFGLGAPLPATAGAEGGVISARACRCDPGEVGFGEFAESHHRTAAFPGAGRQLDWPGSTFSKGTVVMSGRRLLPWKPAVMVTACPEAMSSNLSSSASMNGPSGARRPSGRGSMRQKALHAGSECRTRGIGSSAMSSRVTDSCREAMIDGHR